MNQKPLSDLLAVQKEFEELLKKYHGNERLTKEFCNKIEAWAVREEKARRAIKEDTFENRERVMEKLHEIERGVAKKF